MSYLLNYTGDEIAKCLEGSYHNPIQDVVGDNYTSGSPLAMTGGVEYDFVCNGNTREFTSFPSYITNIWNTTTNIATFPDFINTQMMQADISFTFDPSTATAGNIYVKVYVNETVPILISQKSQKYKSTPEPVTITLTFYTGDETGFDVKNKGVFFKVESDANGDLYDTSIKIYRT